MSSTMGPAISSAPSGLAETVGDHLLYDGDCPFCSAYVRLMRLREAGIPLQILSARDRPDLVGYYKSRGLDLDEGMVLRLGDRTYFGADVLTALALLSGPTGTFNRMSGLVLRNAALSRLLYPALRAGRNLTLRMLGRRRIS
jgi:predicted DCC family thiol-disulfide oxidoreductase YuxK